MRRLCMSVWRALQVGGYQIEALDTVGFFPPRLKGCATQHYQSLAGKALPAIGIGLMGAIGRVIGQWAPRV